MKEKSNIKIAVTIVALVALVGGATAVSATTIGTNVTTSGTVTITSASASALTVGLAGATNPALKVDASTATSATGLKIKSAAAAGGLALSVITSGTNENLTIDAAGSGTITLGGTSTGDLTSTRVINANKGIDFTDTVITAAAGPLVLAGTAATPLASAVASTKFIQIYTKTTATTAGSETRSIYNRLELSGATTGGGESLRSYTEIDGVAVGTAHGAHITLGLGESTTKGSVTGLGVGVRSQLILPDGAVAAGGTYAALQPEIYSFGANSTPAAVTELSFIRVVNDGSTEGIAAVDAKAFLFSLQGFANAGGGAGFVTTYASSPTFTKGLRVKVGSSTFYIPLTVTATN